MEVLGLDHVYLSVSDLARSERFYDRVMALLGFRKGDKAIGGEPHAHYFNPRLQLTLRPARSAARHDPYAPGLHHLCLQLPGPGDVDAAAAALREFGVSASEPRLYPEYAPDYYATFFEDPDGLRLELVGRTRHRQDLADHWAEFRVFVNPLAELRERRPAERSVPASRDLDQLRQLEESLWRAETRFDREAMRRVFAEDFLEFGRSSRVYRLEDALSIEPGDIPARLPLPNLEIRLLHPDVALLTYESDVAYASGRQRARRSSLWIRTPAGWRLRFHQGTPIPDGEAVEAAGGPHAPGWSVWRQDDHGHRFEVRRGLDRAAADRLRDELEAGGHKQSYWVAPTTRAGEGHTRQPGDTT